MTEGSPTSSMAESDAPIPRPAVFVDRDGTLNANAPHGDYVRRPEEVRVLPGAAAGLKRLRDAGFLLVVFTNQSGVSRGVMTREDVEAVA